MDYPTDNVSSFRLSCIGQGRQPNSVPFSRPKLEDCAAALGWASSPAQVRDPVKVTPLAPDQAAIGTPARGSLETVKRGFSPGFSFLLGRTQLESGPAVALPPAELCCAVQASLTVDHYEASGH